MKKTSLLSLIFILFSFISLNAQLTKDRNNAKVKFLSLSNDNFQEFYNNDSIVQIGTTLLNTYTNKIVGFVADDTTELVISSDNSSRWTSIDPLAQKYCQLSPYVYVANNPIVAFDPNGKEIYVIHEDGAVTKARQSVLNTQSGANVWNKYSNSKTHDVYITSQKQDAGQYGVTLRNIGELGLVKDNKISLNLKNDVQKDFSSLNNLDVSKSKGRQISLLSFNETTMDKASDTRNAKTFFHELKAHIDLATGGRTESDQKQEHQRLGVEYSSDNNNNNTEKVIPNSPMDNFSTELELNKVSQNIENQIKFKPSIE